MQTDSRRYDRFWYTRKINIISKALNNFDTLLLLFIIILLIYHNICSATLKIFCYKADIANENVICHDIYC